MEKIIISGYYGFDNFGDDAILYSIVSELKKHIKAVQITVISNNPDKIKRIYGVNSIHRFDMASIQDEMQTATAFISGGGSLLQNVTSFKSLLYYLNLIRIATSLSVKTIIFAQGIGPINTIFARFLTRKTLNKVNLITVRDKESRDFLNKLKLDCHLGTDPVWGLKINAPESILNKDKTNVGIQLREWKTLTDKSIEVLADAVLEKFNAEVFCINLIALQETQDLASMQKLKEMLIERQMQSEIKIFSNLTVEENINLLGSLDYLIAMRFHACLAAANYSVPTLALSYDPKVKSLALESQIPYINIDSLAENKKDLLEKINLLISNNEKIMVDLNQFAERKAQISRENFDLLIKTIMRP
jgi:polysaccharide pyruvyl transferase CsaB